MHDKSKAVRAFLAEHPSIRTEQPPSYTPEANPDEGVWKYDKHGRLANFAAEDTVELRAAVSGELDFPTDGGRRVGDCVSSQAKIR